MNEAVQFDLFNRMVVYHDKFVIWTLTISFSVAYVTYDTVVIFTWCLKAEVFNWAQL